MKTFSLVLLLFIISIVIYSQDAAAIRLHNNITPYQNNGEYDNLLFTNINLSSFTGPQNEPSVRINRINPNIVVAAWRDFRLGWDPSPVRRIGYTYSTNGGLNWAVAQLLPDPNPEHTSQSDPVVVSDVLGHFYISSTSRQPVTGFNRDMLIYKSTNNGQTFTLHATAVPGSGGAGEDKEWIFWDPVPTNSTYNTILISWTSFGPSPGIRFRKSNVGGSTWSATVNVGDNTSGQGSNICTGTGGQIYVVWAANGIRFDKSTNSGTSFGTDFQLSSVASTNDYPFICCDYSNRPSRGNVYVVWSDNRAGTYDAYIQRSTNAGANWLTTPIMINDVTTGSQYWPVIQCDTNGYLYVMYYDTRLGAAQVNSWIAYSTNQGTTWVNNRLSDVSFPANDVGTEARYGDYIGIDAFAGKVMTVWTDDRAGTPNQEIYTANLTGLIGVHPVSNEIPTSFNLYQNFPNPFNPVTKIKFDISKLSVVTVKVYDALGKEISIPVNEQLNSGTYEFPFDASKLTSGVYFYEIDVRQAGSSTGSFKDVKKMMFIK